MFLYLGRINNLPHTLEGEKVALVTSSKIHNYVTLFNEIAAIADYIGAMDSIMEASSDIVSNYQ